jgi:hypothetical protein
VGGADAHLEGWRVWLRRRYGDRLDAVTLEEAAIACEKLRSLWEPLTREPLDAAEAPFPAAPAPPPPPPPPPDDR